MVVQQKSKKDNKKKWYKFLIKTDASVKDGKATQSFIISTLKSDGKGGQRRYWGSDKSKTFTTLHDNIMMAEAIAISEALKFARESRMKNILLKTDSSRIVDAVKAKNHKFKNSSLQIEINAIIKLVELLDVTIQHIPRELNTGRDKACSKDQQRKQSTFRIGKKVIRF